MKKLRSILKLNMVLWKTESHTVQQLSLIRQVSLIAISNLTEPILRQKNFQETKQIMLVMIHLVQLDHSNEYMTLWWLNLDMPRIMKVKFIGSHTIKERFWIKCMNQVLQQVQREAKHQAQPTLKYQKVKEAKLQEV